MFRASFADCTRVLLAAALLSAAPLLPSRARAQSAPAVAEPAPSVDPRSVDDPAAPPADEPRLPEDDALIRLMDQDVAQARPVVRRAARSSSSGATRALALRLLGQYDASSATSRICARTLRIDADPLVRRAAAECLGRVGFEHTNGQTAALVAALDDESLDVVTMAGWALANGGGAAAYARVVTLTRHEDPRVARLFLGYAERMRARLGLDFAVDSAEDDEVRRDAEGRKLIPPGVALTASMRGLDVAVSTAWLGVYGASVGWLHGTLLPSAHGGPDGATVAPLVGLGASVLGGASLAAYGFVRADSIAAAHTIVQLGTAGTLAGFGAGVLAGEPPDNAVAAANLSLVGTLGGTALGILLVESNATPTLGSLAFGSFTGISTMIGVGGLMRAYLPSDSYTFGMAALAGGMSAAGATLATWDQEIGLFPLGAGTLGLMLGTGVGGGTALLLEPQGYTETSGWLVMSGALVGGAGGTLLGLLLPREFDPMLSPDIHPGIQIKPPSWAFLDDGRGKAVPAMVLSGRF